MIDTPAFRMAAVALIAVTLSGCSSLSPDEAAAGDTALAFSAALSSGDADQACDLLAEGARTELEQSTNTPCDSAILDEDLPSADQIIASMAYGRNARVILNGDVLFLSVEDREWKVIAAGCEFRPNKPYDCSVKGG